MRLVPYDRYTIVGPFVVPHVPPATPMCDETVACWRGPSRYIISHLLSVEC